jgi:SAM-dependent methyltransferase
MTFERHPASMVTEAGILWIDRENRRIQRTMRNSSEKFVMSEAYQNMAGTLWPGARKIDGGKWEVDYVEYPIQIMEMTNQQVLEAHLFLCDVLKYLNENGYSMCSHVFNVTMTGTHFMLIDIGDFSVVNGGDNVHTLMHCLRGRNIRNRPGSEWCNRPKLMESFIRKDPRDLDAIKEKFIEVGCKDSNPNRSWDGYSGRFSSLDQVIKKNQSNLKHSTAMKYIKEKMPENLTDLGCNTGQIAIEAAAMGINSIGLDYAPRTIDMAWNNAKSLEIHNAQFGCTNLLDPLVVSTYDPPKLKCKSEMVVAAALLHHLFRSCRDINRCIDTILDYTTKYAAIEFIPHNDQHIKARAGRWHNLEQIEERLNFHGYKITEVTKSQPNPRKWILAEKTS